jgi:hypothetical protein
LRSAILAASVEMIEPLRRAAIVGELQGFERRMRGKFI